MMKFTTMQQALAMGALTAVAVSSSQADNATGGSAELVLYVVNTTNGNAYSRGLGRVGGLSTYINIAGTGINGAVTVAGSTYTGSLTSAYDSATLTAAQSAVNAIGGTNGYGSQATISVNYSLPTVTPDPNLITWLAANVGGDIKWSVQGGNGGGNGSLATRRFVTTSAGNYDAGTNVTNSNLGMATTESNVWIGITSVVAGDNALNPSVSNGDGTSITNSTYWTYNGAGAGTTDVARTWFATDANRTNPANSIDALCNLGSSCNLYLVVSNNVNTAGGGRVFTFTMNDVMLNSAGFLKSLGHK